VILVPLKVCVFKKGGRPLDWQYLLWTSEEIIRPEDPEVPEELEIEEEER